MSGQEAAADFTDVLFRTEAPSQANAGDARAEVARMFARSVVSGEMTADD